MTGIADMVTAEFCESKDDLGLYKMFDDQSGLVINCEESWFLHSFQLAWSAAQRLKILPSKKGSIPGRAILFWTKGIVIQVSGGPEVRVSGMNGILINFVQWHLT